MSTNSADQPTQLKRWRLILGKQAQESLEPLGPGPLDLDHDEATMDEALAAIYDETDPSLDRRRGASSGPSSPRLAKWLGDVRTFFEEDVVTVIQQDAIERKGLTQLLFEPEMLKNVQPSVSLVSTLISLRGRIPERTKDTARMVVRAVVDRIRLELEQGIRQAVMGALNRNAHSPIPNAKSIDWRWTIGRNLRHYRPELQKIVPERVYFYARAQRTNHWTVIVDMDQSGSMADSIVYGAVMGSILASLPAVNTRVVAFDTEVVDLTEQCGNDPVDMLFGVQLGGGTDINKSVAYCQQFMTDPARTLFFLLTDLYEGGNETQLVRRLEHMVGSGVRVMCLLALCDSGVPSFDEGLAKKLAGLGIPCFACTPNKLPDLLEGALRGADLDTLARSITT